MPFVPSAPNAYDINLIPQEVRAQYFEEILLLSPLSMFMGETTQNVIQIVRHPDASGKTTTFALSREIDYTQTVTGFDQISGKGQQITFYEDQITVDQRAIVDVLKGIQLTKMLTPIDVYNAMKPKLQNAHKRNLVMSLLQSATTGVYNPGVGGTGPLANRVVYAGTGYQGTIAAGVAAQNGGIAYNQNGLSVAHIKSLRDLAIYGGVSFEQEKRINPFDLEMKDGFPVPSYVYLMDTPSYNALSSDPLWRGYYFRNSFIESGQPTGLSGAFAKGRIDDVIVYEVPELGKYQVTAGGFTSSWNLFCGAQAFGLVWHREPWYAQEISNMGTIIEMAMIEIRGQKSLMFPSYNPALNGAVVENGIIHSFARIA